MEDENIKAFLSTGPPARTALVKQTSLTLHDFLPVLNKMHLNEAYMAYQIECSTFKRRETLKRILYRIRKLAAAKVTKFVTENHKPEEDSDA